MLLNKPSLSAAGQQARLLINLPDGTKSEYALPELTRIGRHPINTLKLSDREISKEHAEIAREGADWWISDIGSSNGTFVNGRRIQRFKLRDGDEILLGATTIQFRGPAGAPGGAQTSQAGVTMVQSFAPHVLASLRADDVVVTKEGFRPEREINDVNDLRRDYEKLRIANEFHRQVGLETDLHTLYEKILKVAFDLLNADNGVVLVWDQEKKELEPAAVRKKKPVEVMLPQTLLDKVVASREGLLTQDAIIDSRFSASQSIVAQGIRSAMAVPLISKGELRGVLYIDTRERAGAFTEKDLRILSGVASQAAISVENTELARRIEQEAETRAHLSRFLSPHMVEQAQKGQLELAKGGELCEITALFADIRGFTTISEKQQPQEVVTLLNEYFELMVDVVFAHGGVLDKFIGDCIMALWGTPVRRPDDASRALRAAVDMQSKLAEWNVARQRAGKMTLEMGVGINTGQAVVGNMGSSKRLEYTAIGDAVNTASRLCNVARGGEIVASESTVEKGGQGFDYDQLPAAKVKGKEKPISVYRILGYEESTNSG
ncbi:MAG: adenylate/guanylate cyclase domain-containing protein [Myxococcales bacterium]